MNNRAEKSHQDGASGNAALQIGRLRATVSQRPRRPQHFYLQRHLISRSMLNGFVLATELLPFPVGSGSQLTVAVRFTRVIREYARLLALCKTFQRSGKSVDIIHLDVLVCRKARIAAEHVDIGTGRADK